MFPVAKAVLFSLWQPCSNSSIYVLESLFSNNLLLRISCTAFLFKNLLFHNLFVFVLYKFEEGMGPDLCSAVLQSKLADASQISDFLLL